MEKNDNDSEVAHCCGTPENPETGTCWCGITDFGSETVDDDLTVDELWLRVPA